MTSKVYVVQQQMKYDKDVGGLVPRFSSIEKASRWGELIYVLSPGANVFEPEVVLGSLHGELKEFTDDDALLLIGNPGLIGMATAVAAHYNEGRVRLLQWSGKHGEYTEVVAKIY